MTNLVSLVRSMLDSGTPVDEIVRTLKEMGVSEQDAHRLIVLANREILLTLRNDLREIVRDVLEDERERFLSELRQELNSLVEARMKTINRHLFRMVKEEMERYVKELSRVEERLDLLERRLFDVEKRIVGGKGLRVRVLRPGVFMALVGIAMGIAAYFLPLDFIYRVGLGIVAVILIVGGVLLG